MGKLKNVMASKLFQNKSKEEPIEKNDAKKIESSINITTHSPMKCEKLERFIDINDFNDLNDSDTLKEKLYHLERSFLYEQKNIIEKIEQEKYEIVENFRQEKRMIKKVHEREKLDLLKEIERKDKIIHQLARVFKEEHDKKAKQVEDELLKILKSKIESLNHLEEKTCTFMNDLRDFVENNQENLCDMQNYKKLFEDFDKISNIPLPKLEDKFSESFNTSQDDSHLSLKFDRSLNLNSTSNTTLCKCTTCDRTERFDETAVQHELAQAYRKQKSELLRLFNTEKEEYEKTLNAKQKRYEMEVRKEYENRMAIERKAWQETIEDYEREISILKFEREQMDRNYCIGMDQMKTEFEREKRSLHRRYRDIHAELKKTLIATSKPNTEDADRKSQD